MKRLYRAMVVGAVGLSALLGGCSGGPDVSGPEFMGLEGIVFSESYMPAGGGFFVAKSRYAFSMDTEFGRKGVQVYDGGAITKEAINALVEPGTKVEIKIGKSEVHQPIYVVFPTQVRVLK